MNNFTSFLNVIPERASAVISAKIKDESGNSLTLSGDGITSLKLTLYNMSDLTNTIINLRDTQDVFNKNNVSLDSLCNLTWIIQPADNVILDQTLREETHRAIFEWIYANNTKIGKHILDLKVINLERPI